MEKGLWGKISGAFNRYADAVDNQFDKADLSLTLNEPGKFVGHAALGYAGTATLIPLLLVKLAACGAADIARLVR